MADPQYRDGLTGSRTEVWLAVFERQKAFAEHALAHLDGAAFFRRPAVIEGTNVNSVAIIVRHMTGNMRSRWTDFLTGDGEKPWRDRDGEFVEPEHGAESRLRLMAEWDEAWALLFATVASLGEADFEKTVLIRGRAHTLEAAVVRQIDHYATHIGQIVTTARLLTPEAAWRYFTVPPGGTAAFNRSMGMGG